MPIRSYKPVTPSQRYIKRSTFEEITKTKPETVSYTHLTLPTSDLV